MVARAAARSWGLARSAIVIRTSLVAGTERYDAESCSPSAVPRRPRTEKPRVRRRPLGSRGMLLCRQSASHYKPSSPARSAPAVWWLDRIRIQAAAGDQPRDHRVGVPHLAGGQLVPAPNWRREGRHQVKQSACTVCVIRQPPRAIDRLADIRDDTIAPTTHLGAEDPKAPCPARANRATSGHATPRSVTARDGRLLNHEASLRHAHLKRGVVEITRRPMLEPRHHRFEHATVETHGMATRPQRQPVQIDASNGLTAAGTRLLEVVGRHPSKGSHDRTGSILSCGRSQDLARSETRCPRGAGVGRFVEQMRGETREQVSVAAATPEWVP